MSNNDFKDVLMREHTRDKKLTYINFTLIATVAIILVILFQRFILVFLQTEELYPKLALGGICLFYIGFCISKIIKLSKREKDIQELLEKVEAGARATNISEFREYKISVPLGKITYRLYPVEFLMVMLDSNPMRYYNIPVPGNYIPDLKNILSGANIEQLNQTLSELYDNGKQIEYNNEITPLKTIEEFREYIENELSGTIQDVEKSRKSAKKVWIIGLVFSLGVVIAFMGYNFYNAFSGRLESNPYTMYIPVLIFFVIVYAVYGIFIRPRQLKAAKEGSTNNMYSAEYTFKIKVFEKIVKFISPDTQYIMHGHISYPEFMESGLFSELNYDISGNDLIAGRHNGVPFQFCDLQAVVRKKITKENESPEYAFYGQYFVARFNKTFSSPVYITPKSGLKGYFSDKDISQYLNVSGEKVILEDPEFMKMFNVYGEDQVEARYILTPSMMEKIKELAVRTSGRFHISFRDDKITVANNSWKNNFEVSQFKSYTKDNNQLIIGFYKDLCDQFAIIDELKLNIKIWK